jgi:tetratricopeptide (TPR) repeat protein
MDLKELLPKVHSGKVRVKQIGSISVADSANPSGVAIALETSQLAKESSKRAKMLWQEGRLEEAASALLQSIVFEDTIGNKYGIASDLGNLATIYSFTGTLEKAKAIYIKALELSGRLIEELPERQKHLGTPPEIAISELREYQLLHGLHLEGLSRCLVSLGNLKDAQDHLKQAMNVYQKAGAARRVSETQALMDRLKGRA